MRQRALSLCMRPAPLLVLVLLLAGCLAPAAEVAAPPAPPGVAPVHLEGEVWVEPSSGGEPSRHEVPFWVNATGRNATATVSFGERYLVADLPQTSGYFVVRIEDAAGEALAEEERMLGGPMEIRLELPESPMGELRLVVLARSGSDGSSMGARFAYVVDVA